MLGAVFYYGLGVEVSTNPKWRNTATFLIDPSGITCSALSRRENANTGTRPISLQECESSSIKNGAPPNIALSPGFAPQVISNPTTAILRMRRSSLPGISSKVRCLQSSSRISVGRSTTPCAFCSGVAECWVAFHITSLLSTSKFVWAESLPRDDSFVPINII